MNAPAEPMSSCRRKALWCLAAGLACVLGSYLSYRVWHLDARMSGFLGGIGVGLLFAAVLQWFSPDMSDAVPKRLIRRYQRQIAVSMSAYVLIMLVWKRLLDAVELAWLKWAIALFPALLVCWVMRAFVQYVRDSDEMQRRIELESGAIGAMLVAAVYLGLGFLQSAKLIDIAAGPALIMVFPAMCLFYGIVKIFVSRRYL